MRQIIIRFFSVLLTSILLLGCQEDEPTLQAIAVPTNVRLNAQVANDQSGNVTVSPSADDALYFHVYFTPGGDPMVVSSGESKTFRFTQSGQYEAPITMVAFGVGGVSSSITEAVSLDVKLLINAETLQLIGGDGTKRWVWDQTVGGHFGVGPLTNDFPEFFSAGPNQLNPCLYDDVLVFNYDDNDNYSFNLEPGANNETFMNWTEINRFFPDATPQQFNDECRDITDQATFSDNFVIIDNGDGTSTLDVGNGFLSYWAVISGEYQIMELTENRLTVRGISQPFNGDDPLAWYFSFVPEGGGTTGSGQTLETIFNNLVWSDEFNIDGAPDTANWTYDLGTGDNGWGNGELQSYTDLSENALVEGGNLKITAKTSSTDPTLYYLDDVQLADASGNPQAMIEDFEGTAPTFENFGGGISQVIANPDASGENTSSNVVEFSRSTTAESFAGSYFDLGSPLDLSINNKLSIKTWSPKVGAVVKLKLENSANSAESFEVDMNTTVSNAWETLVYDFSSAPNFNYDRVVFFFDFGITGNGAAYTSARIKSEGLQEFTYGRVEARAKLPNEGGTWSAIWMLGSDYLTNPWPAAGEMDVMEHVGNQQDVILGTTHDPTAFGGNANTGSTLVNGASNEFHIYEMEWTASEIKFAVDGIVYHTVSNDPSLPFNKDFFFIINVAMGGTLGGDVDPSFAQSTLEVDYIRMYQ